MSGKSERQPTQLINNVQTWFLFHTPSKGERLIITGIVEVHINKFAAYFDLLATWKFLIFLNSGKMIIIEHFQTDKYCQIITNEIRIRKRNQCSTIIN
jgi:hypothetical protein